MNWFFKWLTKKLTENAKANRPSLEVAMPVEKGISADGMNLSIYNATGGHIVEFRRYDHMKDRSANKLYLITADQHFPEALAKIVSMEMIR